MLRGFAPPELQARGAAGARAAGGRGGGGAGDFAGALGDPLAPAGAAIVYAATRRSAERIAGELRARGWDAAGYHAGLDPDLRSRVSAAFAERSLPVVVATSAFGMGIDRPDVRVVVHAELPASIEAYYQEVGRAGRDGEPARGLLLFARADVVLRRRFAALGEAAGPESPADPERALRLLRELLRYVGAVTCRHDFILRYFGDAAASIGCGRCDVCQGLDEVAIAPGEDRPPPVRAAASPPAPAPASVSAVADALARGMDPGLFEALRAHRAGLARARALPPYVIAPNRTLTEIAILRPRSAEDLALVHGMGPARLSAYGDGLLAVVREGTAPTGSGCPPSA